jgi:hypothetical protein
MGADAIWAEAEEVWREQDEQLQRCLSGCRARLAEATAGFAEVDFRSLPCERALEMSFGCVKVRIVPLFRPSREVIGSLLRRRLLSAR